MAKLIAYPHTNPLVEAFQINAIRFAFCNDTSTKETQQFSAVHAPVKCREYFNELLMCNKHEDFKYSPVFGFKYLQKDFPLNLDKTRIAIYFESPIQADKFKSNLKWLHLVEDFNGIDQTIIHSVDESTHILIVEGSKMWMQKCVLLNIYTLLLKLCSLGIADVESFKNLSMKSRGESEITYINCLGIDNFNKLLENCTLIADLPSKYVDGSNTLRHPSNVHSYSGIMYIHQQIQNNRTDNQLPVLTDLVSSIYKGQANNTFLKAA